MSPLAEPDVQASPGNDDFEWDHFDSGYYFEHNYARPGPDDKTILRKVGTFFAACLPEYGPRRHRGGTDTGSEPRRGIDVGAGANLYPALAMLPYCDEITLLERARPNRDWLAHQLTDGNMHPCWSEFWATLRPVDRRYAGFRDFRQVLQDRARVCPGNVFTLRQESARYDVGTMFFVAESITERHDEFIRAVRNFIQVLKPGAPFAAAFMRKSEGYPVAGYRFPAVSIVEQDVRKCLRSVDPEASIDIINDEPVRAGYEGMILATGRAGARR